MFYFELFFSTFFFIQYILKHTTAIFHGQLSCCFTRTINISPPQITKIIRNTQVCQGNSDKNCNHFVLKTKKYYSKLDFKFWNHCVIFSHLRKEKQKLNGVCDTSHEELTQFIWFISTSTFTKQSAFALLRYFRGWCWISTLITDSAHFAGD